MKKLACLLAGLLLAGCGNHAENGASVASDHSGGGTAVKLKNPGFEEPAKNDTIPGWLLVQHAGAPAYKVALDPDSPYAGKDSMRITRTQPQVYGSLIQRVDARNLVGKTVELTAMLRCKDVGPKGLKLLLSGGRPDTNRYSPALAGTKDWQRQTIRLKVPRTVQTLTLGVTLLDSGTGWLDDVQLRVVD